MDDECYEQFATKLPKLKIKRADTSQFHRPSQVGRLNVRKYWDEHNPLASNCLIDYVDPEVLSTIKGSVDCEEECGSAEWEEDDEKEYLGCVEACEHNIESTSTGSVVVDRDFSTIEANIPVSPEVIYDYDENVSYDQQQDKQLKLVRRIEKLGCQPMKFDDIGWMHAHEFNPNHVEREEDYPAVVFLHLRKKPNGSCRFDEVYKKVTA